MKTKGNAAGSFRIRTVVTAIVQSNTMKHHGPQESNYNYLNKFKLTGVHDKWQEIAFYNFKKICLILSHTETIINLR